MHKIKYNILKQNREIQLANRNMLYAIALMHCTRRRGRARARERREHKHKPDRQKVPKNIHRRKSVVVAIGI